MLIKFAENDLLKMQVMEQQEDIFELKSKPITITSKKENLQHEINTVKNVKVNTKNNKFERIIGYNC